MSAFLRLLTSQPCARLLSSDPAPGLFLHNGVGQEATIGWQDESRLYPTRLKLTPLLRPRHCCMLVAGYDNHEMIAII